ncbi:MAG: L,D-transpeptidase [Xanthobacteraceae bacterium]
MFRKTALALAISASFLVAGHAGRAEAQYSTQYSNQVASYNGGGNMGGGFIEYLFGGQQSSPYQQQYEERAPQPYQQPQARQPHYREPYQQQYQPQYEQSYQPAYRERIYQEPEREQAYEPAGPARPSVDPKFMKQVVNYSGKETAGTIVIDTPSKFLYLVRGDGTALRYGVGVGKPGFTWAGVKTVSMKKEWPSWTPPAEMLKRRPDLPRFMEGGPENPLGARALYLGSSLYRIHGSNEPWTIGTNVSSGCIRMRNEDVIDLYNRVKVGARVVVI